VFNYKETNSSVTNKKIPFQKNISRSLSKDIIENIARIKEDFGDSSDLIIRHETLGEGQNYSFAIIHIDGISNEKLINEGIIEKIVSINKEKETFMSLTDLENGLKSIISVSSLKSQSSYTNLLSALLLGDTIVLLDQDTNFLVACTKLVQTRSITEPSTQTVIRGPKDSFTESLRTNTSLVRNRIQHPALRIESMKIGEITRTDIEIMYIKGVVDNNLLQEVKHRLEAINVDEIVESSYIENYIQNDQKTLFPTMLHTERPDAVVGNLLEGRVAIFTAGTPYVLILPATFTQFFQSPEDYYQSSYIGTFLRILRYGSFWVALFAPALFIAITSFHQAIIPTVLLVSLAAQREGVPLPAIVEAIGMELIFEVLREAGIRMPRAVGQALSIVGALILGQAAVQAGFVSASMVIIVSITAIASFTIPYYNMSIAARILRFFLLLAGAYIGLFGILIGGLIILIHMCSLRSFGEPYFAPFAPFRLQSQKDTILVVPTQGNTKTIKEQSSGE
jgi:spore germination protein KA